MDTFNVADGGYVRPENEREALCDSKMSKISPLSGGEIVFPTLEGNKLYVLRIKMFIRKVKNVKFILSLVVFCFNKKIITSFCFSFIL